ncbi:hypothetical protein BDN72DRAFT_962287 [Pluteus cervinus]|uniref:Uncharacterized protein n=1 Tax=Pluteus cervinus TaxID=181527 RepID=A0ACD3AK40_9AGAR|nr:hypothetical protein BDN72DRAFT_962287 [Pluteus cervinus]
MLTMLLASFWLFGAQAAPISTGPHTIPTIIHTVIFGIQARSNCSEADVRTLYEIVRSCFLTIAACVYRSIHQNIPDPRATFLERQIGRVKITFCALIAPELMIWWAMRQRFGAKVIAEKVNALRPGLGWTQTHGHFAQMGGFGRKDDKRVLYPPTLIKLLENGQLEVEELQLSRKDIEDKSKGDILSKTVVALQTSWFVLECLARLQQKLPLLELEVVTLAFATLNVLTYALWWYKPLDVLCPIYLHVRPLQPPQATSPPSDSHSQPESRDTRGVQLSGQHPLQGDTNLGTNLIAGGIEASPDATTTAPAVSSTPETDGTDQTNRTAKQSRREKTRIMESAKGGVQQVVHGINADIKEHGWLKTSWKRMVRRPFRKVVLPLWELFHDAFVHEDAMHISRFYAMRIPKREYRLIKFLSCVIGMIFGAMHFISWDSSFPTKAELRLWRISSIVLVVQPFLMLITEGWKRNYWKGTRIEKIADRLYRFCRIVSFYIGPIPYIVARFSVLLLALLTLRDIRPDAVNNASWAYYIPHL